MGCAESKLDTEDNVRRCKERRRLMKEAVYARHHLAAAHSDYCRSLRITGSTLVAFASGEPLAVSHHTPAVFLRTPPPPAAIPKSSPPHPPSPSVPAPPPMSTASSNHQQPPPPFRRKKPIKLPHILSESSFTSSPPPNHNVHYNPGPNSTYSTTPSQVSSVWNWDNFYPPPSPPNSEYFDRLHNNNTAKPRAKDNNFNYDRYTDNDDDEKSSIHTSHSNARNQRDRFHNPLHSLSPSESEEEETEREEVQCSEWGDHDHDNYTTTSCSSDQDEAEDLKSRSDFAKNEATKAPTNPRYATVDVKSKVESNSEKPNLENDDNGNRGRGNSDKRIMVRHKDLAEIVAAINEYFEKAASSGEQVSGILEIGRAQLDQRFKQLKSE